MHNAETAFDFECTQTSICYMTIFMGVVLPMLWIAFVRKRVLTWHGIRTQTLTIKNLGPTSRVFLLTVVCDISKTMLSQQNVSVTASSIYRSVPCYPPKQSLAHLRLGELQIQAEEQKTQTAKNFLRTELTRPCSQCEKPYKYDNL